MLITELGDERLVDGDAVPARHVALYRDSLRAALEERDRMEKLGYKIGDALTRITSAHEAIVARIDVEGMAKVIEDAALVGGVSWKGVARALVTYLLGKEKT